MKELTDVCEIGVESASVGDEIYTLTIDLNVLEHLGINLYSNVPAVLTEVVANAWDANATEVEIDVDSGLQYISIRDNGFGMTVSDINNKFLRVGYKKRAGDVDLTPAPFYRPVMGRKGVGKLAPFSIAETIEVYSTCDGVKSALSMNVDAIKLAASDRDESGNPKDPEIYHPKPIAPKFCPDVNGTVIRLYDLKKERIRVENLAQRLARRFSVIGTKEFSVRISGRSSAPREITSKDRGDLDKLQYLWSIGGWSKPSWVEGVKREAELEGRLDGWPEGLQVKGWIGTVNKPKDLESAAGNLNVIVVLARGRLFQENILGDVNDGRYFMSYLVGQIEADFLDSTPEDDIATSDRQRVKEDDPRYAYLVSYLKSVLTKIEAKWSEWRPKDRTEDVKKVNPVVTEWFGSLKGVHLKHAEKLIGRIAAFDYDDPEEERVLLKHAVLGFERLRLTGNANELANAVSIGASALLPLLADLESVEASLYRDIVLGRLDVIRAFLAKIEANDLERTLQEFLFNHLWLIDPAWERVTGSEIIERPVNDEFDRIKAGLTEEEIRGRVDIKYRTITGKHVIIELKRPDRTVSVDELIGQGKKYKNALLKCLRERQREREPYEFIFVLGKPLKEENDIDGDEYIANQLGSIKGRVVNFQNLVTSAQEGYKEYLEANSKVDRIGKLVRSFD
ncbi:BbrUII/HgiDII family restriction enzyme [Pseudomonas aeruginosa]|uniref:BbrUII/HgiDII family restriction enzyme n=1 Tax=Pseudomonas aeruginosa TaxID=287 RepID=UPI002E17D08D|nr:ATP-binding protein [Pseudomonas aeruginosa]